MGLAAWKHDNKAVAVEVTGNKTLAITDVGIAQVVTADAVVFTLPATVVGYVFTVVNGSDQIGTVGISVSPAAADKIAGNGFTATDDKDAINTKATAQPGDMLTLIGDGVNGWFVEKVKGVWAREA